MADELVTTDSQSKAIAVARLQEAVGKLYRSIEKDRDGSDMLPALPSPDTRKGLEERRRALHGKLRSISLAQAEQDRARGAIAMFLGAYIGARSADPDGTSRLYVGHLMDQPLFAIMQALDDFRHGRVFDLNDDGKRIPFTLDYAPSAFRVLDQVKKRAADVQEENFQILRILAVKKVISVPSLSNEERERVAEQMRLLANGLMQRASIIREKERALVKAEADQARDRAQKILQDARHRRAAADGIRAVG